MEEILNAIKEFIDWYIGTSLPKDTADTLLEIIKVAGTKVYDLLQEYSIIIFGG